MFPPSSRLSSHVLPAALGFLVLALPAGAATTVYVNSSGFCAGTPCFTTIQAGVEAAGGGPSTVFVEAGTFAESVDISQMGTGIGAGGAADLALEAVGSVSIEPTSGAAIYNSVPDFAFDVSISGFDVTSPDTDAIDIEGCDGSVEIMDVVADGAFYDGVDVRADQDITITNVQSRNNGNDGFQIEFEDVGDLEIRNSVAEDNGFQDCRLRGNPGCDGNDGFQIFVFDGTVEIVGSRADDNEQDGFEIRATPGGIIQRLDILATQSNRNGSDGFQIEDVCSRTSLQTADCEVRGGDDVRNTILSISVVEAVANDNGQDGFEIYAMYDQSVVSRGSAPVLEMRRVTANGNGTDGDGDGIDTDLGPNELDDGPLPDVIFEDVTTIGNEHDGIQLEGFGAEARINDVTFARITSEDNGEDGIEIMALGRVELTDVQANRNGFGDLTDEDQAPNPSRRDGIEVDNGDVSAFEVLATRVTTNDNGGDGFQIYARSRIELREIESQRNGAEVPCRPVVPPPKDPKEPTELCEDENDFRYADGVAINPGQDFANGRGATQDATTDVLIAGCLANDNASDGLDIEVRGFIDVSNCETSGNGEDGIDTSSGPIRGAAMSASVNLNGITTTLNRDDGIDTRSSGPITMIDVCTAENDSDGIKISAVGAPWSITGSQALGNRFGIALGYVEGQTGSLSGSDVAGNQAGLIQGFAGTAVAATGNYWGASSGPTHPDNGGGSGDSVLDGDVNATGDVAYAPFATSMIGAAVCPSRGFGLSVLEIPTQNQFGVWVLIGLLGLIGLLALRRLS